MAIPRGARRLSFYRALYRGYREVGAGGWDRRLARTGSREGKSWAGSGQDLRPETPRRIRLAGGEQELVMAG